MREQYLRTGEGFLLVYSIAERQSFKQIGSLYEHILRIKDVDSCPAVIVANKCDLEFDRQVGRNGEYRYQSNALASCVLMGFLFVQRGENLRSNMDVNLLRHLQSSESMSMRLSPRLYGK